MLIEVAFGTATGIMLLVVLASQRWGDAPDRDRLYLGLWLAGYWLAEFLLIPVVGHDAIERVAPAFDFAAGAGILLAWLIRPRHWKTVAWCAFWALCVAHLVYRLDQHPGPDVTYRYRALANALYGCLISVTTFSGVTDLGRAFASRHSGAGGHRLFPDHSARLGGRE